MYKKNLKTQVFLVKFKVKKVLTVSVVNKIYSSVFGYIFWI